MKRRKSRRCILGKIEWRLLVSNCPSRRANVCMNECKGIGGGGIKKKMGVWKIGQGRSGVTGGCGVMSRKYSMPGGGLYGGMHFNVATGFDRC